MRNLFPAIGTSLSCIFILDSCPTLGGTLGELVPIIPVLCDLEPNTSARGV